MTTQYLGNAEILIIRLKLFNLSAVSKFRNLQGNLIGGLQSLGRRRRRGGWKGIS